MTFRSPSSHDPLAEALEELRAVDRLLMDQFVAARTTTPDRGGAASTFASLISVFSFSGTSVHAALEGEQDANDLCITAALAHLHRAVELTGGHLWNEGISASGVPWLLHTSVGLRRAAREYFERLVAEDPTRFCDVAPLSALEAHERRPWPESTRVGVVVLATVASLFLVIALPAGLAPLAVALPPLVATLLWLRARRARGRAS